jgi:hypothetical protein
MAVAVAVLSVVAVVLILLSVDILAEAVQVVVDESQPLPQFRRHTSKNTT